MKNSRLRCLKVNIFAIVVIALSLSGCATVALVGAGVATGGYIAGRDKPITRSMQDTSIDTDVKSKLRKQLGAEALDVSVVTNDGYVLLTGNLPNGDMATEAEKIALAVPGVIAVDNNIVVGKSKLSTLLKDSYITSACRTKLTATSDIKSLNVKIKTMNHVVYLNGTARNQSELEKIINVAKSINGVEKVISYITLVGDLP